MVAKISISRYKIMEAQLIGDIQLHHLDPENKYSQPVYSSVIRSRTFESIPSFQDFSTWLVQVVQEKPYDIRLVNGDRISEDTFSLATSKGHKVTCFLYSKL